MYPPYTFPDRWGPTWSTLPAQRTTDTPPWLRESPCRQRYTRGEWVMLGQDIGWVTVGTSGSW